MIYSKPINDITWQDIEEFCEHQIPEGAYLDYKEDFPNHLENTISAMANSLGGVILIGVEETDENKPQIPIKGINFERGLSTRVNNIILSNITPPIFPEIQVCINDTKDKAIIVIRVAESHQTPHAIMNNTRVYLRTGDQNKPEKLASLDEISWLNNQRKKSITLRDILVQRSNERWNTYKIWVEKELLSKDLKASKPNTGLLVIKTYPVYPNKEYKTPSELRLILNEIRILDYYNSFSYFPPENRLFGYDPSIVQDGIVCINYRDHDERVFFIEINTHGLIYYTQSISRKQSSQDKTIESLIGDEIITRIDEFLDVAGKFFTKIGYWGIVDFNVSLINIKGFYLIFDWYKKLIGDSPIGISPDNNVCFQHQIFVKDINTNKQNLILNAVKKLFWTFNIDFSLQQLTTFYKHVKGI